MFIPIQLSGETSKFPLEKDDLNYNIYITERYPAKPRFQQTRAKITKVRPQVAKALLK